MPTGPTVIDYDPQPAPRFGWSREGDALTLTVPPVPLWRGLLGAAAPLVAVTPFAALGALTCVRCIAAGPQERFFAAPVVGGGSVALWGLALRTFLHRLRSARRPTVVRVAADALDVSSPDASDSGRRVWEREQIVDVAVVRAGALPAVQQYLHLWVTDRDGGRVVIRMPWPGEEPMSQVEDNLRDVLGLPPVGW